MRVVYNLFEIEDPTTYLLFFVLFVWIDSETSEVRFFTRSLSPEIAGRRRLTPAATYAVAVVAILFIWCTNIIPAYAASWVGRADKTHEQKSDAGRWFVWYGRALEQKTPHKESIRLFMARTLVRMNIPEDQRDEYVEGAFMFVANELAESAQEHPRNPFFLSLEADIWVRMYKFFKTAGALDKAVDLYRQALEVAPRRQQIYLVLADTLLLREEGNEAIAEVKSAIELTPDQPWIMKLGADRLIQAHTLLGAPGALPDALVYYEQALQIASDISQKQKISMSWAEALILDGQGERALELAKQILELTKNESEVERWYEEIMGQIESLED